MAHARVNGVRVLQSYPVWTVTDRPNNEKYRISDIRGDPTSLDKHLKGRKETKWCKAWYKALFDSALSAFLSPGRRYSA